MEKPEKQADPYSLGQQVLFNSLYNFNHVIKLPDDMLNVLPEVMQAQFLFLD